VAEDRNLPDEAIRGVMTHRRPPVMAAEDRNGRVVLDAKKLT
jgi:hypothetical protein